MRAVSIIILGLILAVTGSAAEVLPRKAKAPRETYPNVQVIYDSVTTPTGERLRTIITKPHDARGKHPPTSFRVVPQVRRQPAFNVADRHALARRVVLNLVARDEVDREIARLRVGEIKPAD